MNFNNIFLYFTGVVHVYCTFLVLFLCSRFSDDIMNECFDDVIQEFNEIQDDIIKDIYENELKESQI